jgi:hypothetical protein
MTFDAFTIALSTWAAVAILYTLGLWLANDDDDDDASPS